MMDTAHRLDLSPLSKPENLREQIYAELLARLQLGEIGSEIRLVDTEIARLFGTSRMPAREALLQLTNEGYLVGTTRGFRVPRLADQDVREIFEIRKLLEPRAAAQAVTLLQPVDHAAMQDAVARARDAARHCDAREMIMANDAFRRRWLDAVPNARLSATIARFCDHVQTVRLETLKNTETRHYVADGLDGLRDAFVARDALAVFDRMSAFIGVAEQTYFRLRRAEADARTRKDPA